MHFALRLLWVIMLGGLQQGCVSLPPKTPVTIKNAELLALYKQHIQQVAAIKEFTLQGRMGVRADGKGFSGSLRWQHKADQDEITLYSPLGGQVANINKNADRVTLVDAKGNRVSAINAEALTLSTLGWQLPLDGLNDWILGRPSKNIIESQSWDELGYLSDLHQDGWIIDFQNYTKTNGYMLPGKIILNNDKVNLKLLVEKWDELGN